MQWITVMLISRWQSEYFASKLLAHKTNFGDRGLYVGLFSIASVHPAGIVSYLIFTETIRILPAGMRLTLFAWNNKKNASIPFLFLPQSLPPTRTRSRVLIRGTLCVGVWNTEMEERENESEKWNEWKSMDGQFGFFSIIPWKKSQKKGGVGRGRGLTMDKPVMSPVPDKQKKRPSTPNGDGFCRRAGQGGKHGSTWCR